MTIPDPSTAKRLLRQSMRLRAGGETRDSAPIHRALDGWLARNPDVATLAVFSALPGEPDLADWVALHPERRWAYPRVSGERLAFHPVKHPGTELAAGTFGILEPLPTLTELTPAEIDAFLCPDLAFDPRGGRLGRGRGFYNRMLSNARPDALKIGVCFPWQLVDTTHPEPHDIPMDEVVCGSA